MPNKYLDSVGLAEYTSLVKDYVDTKADDYLPLAGGTLTGNVYTTPYYDSTIVDPEGGQTLIVSKGKVAKGTAPSNNEYHTMVMAVDNSGSTNNAHKYGQVETWVVTDGSVRTLVSAYNNVADSTSSATISVGYDANGNVFTSAPTPTAGDNTTKIATTEFVNTAMANGYLPLSGGTMTGTITFSRNQAIARSNETDELVIFGGSVNSTTPCIALRGKEKSTDAGSLYVRTQDTSQSKILLAKPDGTFTWGGKNVECIESKGTNYIRYVSGLQIVFDAVNGVTEAGTYNYTFPVPFKSYNDVKFGLSKYWGYNTSETCYVRDLTGTGFSLVVQGTVSSNSHGYHFVASGWWK